MNNTVSKINAGSFLVWHTKGKVTLAKCAITGQFVKRASAQSQLNITLSDMTQYAASKQLADIKRKDIEYNLSDLQSAVNRYIKNGAHYNAVSHYLEVINSLKWKLKELEWCK